MTSSAVTNVVFGGREWRLSPECSLEGSLLTVTVPKGSERGMHAAITKVDLSPFEAKAFEATIRVCGNEVSTPPQSYNGVKFMFHFKDKISGTDQWPGAMLPTGTFGWRVGTVGRGEFVGAEGGTGELALGLQDSYGSVTFDLSTLEISEPRPKWPVTNLDHVAAYTPDVSARPRLRGVMSPAREMTEDDFKTLHSWGATLLRYQMIRSWHGVNTNQDLDEFGRWLDGKLDHFDSFVLPMANKYGIMVVLDMHVPPGGRDVLGDMHMFYEEKYASNFIETWRRIAKRFKGRKGIYGYDLINEPAQRLATMPGLDYWSLQVRAAEAIRSEDPLTPIVIESNNWDGPSTFSYLSPVKLTNVIYQVHMYAPMDFTHQWVLGMRQSTFAYPNAEKGWGPKFLRETMKPVLDFQRKHGARIYVGEFSAVCWAPGAENYIRDCIGMFEEYGWDWTYHAYREWAGWSVEHEGKDVGSLRSSPDNPRKRALLDGFKAKDTPAVPKIKVALYLDIGCKGGGVIHWARLLKSSPDVACDFIDAADVNAGKLSGYDVLVMPGGSGYDRYSQLGEEGFEKIRKYIREGGAYYGVCAGIALALNDPKRLRLIPYTREKTPPRGGFSGAVKLNARAEELLGIPAGTRYFRYHDGPLPAKGDPVPDSNYEVLATFDSHVMQKGKASTSMHGMPAVIYGHYGNGKVLVTVMHPEYYPSTHDVLGAGFKPLVGRPVTFAYPQKTVRPLRVAFYSGEIDRVGSTREVVEDALALDARPDVDVTYVSGEQISEGALDHADVLVIPGGKQKGMWKAAIPLVERFKSQGHPVCTTCKDVR